MLLIIIFLGILIHSNSFIFNRINYNKKATLIFANNKETKSSRLNILSYVHKFNISNVINSKREEDIKLIDDINSKFEIPNNYDLELKKILRDYGNSIFFEIENNIK